MSFKANAPIIAGITVNDGKAAVDWYHKAFGAEIVKLSQLEHDAKQRVLHAELKIGAASFFVMDAFPDWGSSSVPPTLNDGKITASFNLEANTPDDVDKIVAKLVEHGAKQQGSVSDMFWGKRHGNVVDPFGHHWSIGADIDAERTEAANEKWEAQKKAMAGNKKAKTDPE